MEPCPAPPTAHLPQQKKEHTCITLVIDYHVIMVAVDTSSKIIVTRFMQYFIIHVSCKSWRLYISNKCSEVRPYVLLLLELLFSIFFSSLFLLSRQTNNFAWLGKEIENRPLIERSFQSQYLFILDTTSSACMFVRRTATYLRI